MHGLARFRSENVDFQEDGVRNVARAKGAPPVVEDGREGSEYASLVGGFGRGAACYAPSPEGRGMFSFLR